jgi:hypothetical protein
MTGVFGRVIDQNGPYRARSVIAERRLDLVVVDGFTPGDAVRIAPCGRAGPWESSEPAASESWAEPAMSISGLLMATNCSTINGIEIPAQRHADFSPIGGSEPRMAAN